MIPRVIPRFQPRARVSITKGRAKLIFSFPFQGFQSMFDVGGQHYCISW